MGSDLGKIQIVGHYLAVIWKPARMNLEGGVVKLQLKIIMMSSQQPKLLTHAWNVQIYSFLSVVGDMVLALAYALEVPHYGSKVGPQTMLKGALDSRINIPNGEKMISK
ncbi:hypothetical protein R6Q59_035981 [Mikania micrantha]